MYLNLLNNTLGFVKTHKTQVFWFVLGLGLGIWLCILFRPATHATPGITTRSEKKIQKEIDVLKDDRSKLNDTVAVLHDQIHRDSLEIVRLRALVRRTSTIIVNKNTNIEKIRKEYETLNRLDSVSDDELTRLFSAYEYPQTRGDKRQKR